MRKSTFLTGGNSIMSIRPVHVKSFVKVPKSVINDEGIESIVYVDEDTINVDLGDSSMYSLENMLKAGIQPSNIQVGSVSRLGAADGFNQMVEYGNKLADTIDSLNTNNNE